MKRIFILEPLESKRKWSEEISLSHTLLSLLSLTPFLQQIHIGHSSFDCTRRLRATKRFPGLHVKLGETNFLSFDGHYDHAHEITARFFTEFKNRIESFMDMPYLKGRDSNCDTMGMYGDLGEKYLLPKLMLSTGNICGRSMKSIWHIVDKHSVNDFCLTETIVKVHCPPTSIDVKEGSYPTLHYTLGSRFMDSGSSAARQNWDYTGGGCLILVCHKEGFLYSSCEKFFNDFKKGRFGNLAKLVIREGSKRYVYTDSMF